MSKTLRFIFDHPLRQWLTGKKEEETEIQKFEYLNNKKSFLDEINIFHSYLRAVIWWKNDKKWNQALSSLLIKVLCNKMICSATMPS